MKRKNENFWESIGNPKTALAPMVSYCDLPFRILCNKYGVDLCYTQMYSSSQFAESESIRQIVLKEIGPKLNFPCFIQLNGHDPEKFLTAAKYLENKTPCIDINLGCPQDIAKRGYYGAFLLDHPEEVYKIIGYLCNNNLKCGISCKIRLFDDLSKTYELAKKLEDLGINCLCVHGRTKEQKQDKVGKCNWDAIKEIKSLLKIPIISNGGIGEFEDIDKCLEYTKCDCVMSGEKLIEMPTFFTKKYFNLDDIVKEYLDLWQSTYSDKKYINENMKIVKGHLHKMYYVACKKNIRFSSKIANVDSFDSFYKINEEIKEFWKDIPIENRYGWYMRHQKPIEQEYPSKDCPSEEHKEEPPCFDDFSNIFD